MKTKVLFTIIVCLAFFTVKSQTNLNNYKYVIVPKKFDFLKTSDQYQLNSLTKFLLEKENFETFFEKDSFPDDLFKDRCLALTANVINESGLFKTKLKVQLQDCRNTTVFESSIGDSKQKAYEKAYHEALREAFLSFKSLNYEYSQRSVKIEEIPTKGEPSKQTSKEQITESNKRVINEEVHTDTQVLPMVITPDTPELSSVKSGQDHKDKSLNSVQNSTENMLYAQSINNGFQLVDRTPKVVYTIYNSGKKDIFIVKGKDAVIYKLNDIWVISEMVNESLKTESLQIKF